MTWERDEGSQKNGTREGEVRELKMEIQREEIEKGGSELRGMREIETAMGTDAGLFQRRERERE